MTSNTPEPQDPRPEGPMGRQGPYDKPGDPYGPPGGTGAPGSPGAPGTPPGYGGPGGGGPPGYGGPGGYGAPGGYGGPEGYGGPPRSPRNGFGIAALVLGIVGVLLFWTVVGGLLLGLLAVIFGILHMRRKKSGEAAGPMGVIGLVLGALGLVGSVIILIAGVSLLNSEEFGSYRECLNDAGNDQAKIEECAREFNEDINR
ncbi:DUF4190 domain-containing protein [Streptomyces chumphonensis]|uniref:DUF4190 domain-containing protein n=1 Tax=Streptomyces chumphonensis TaxID=1214925 RepID=UPI003D744D15